MSNLPKVGYVHVVREDPRKRGFLTLGTELGVYASWNDGQSWVSLRNGLPAVPVVETLVHPRDGDLIIATHGRGIFIMDNIKPLEQLADAMKADAFLFDGPPAVRWQTWGRDNPLGSREWIGQNPARGGMIDFYAKAGGAPATITVTDAAKQPIRTMTVNTIAGVNRAVWDLRYDASPAGTPQPPGPPAGGGGGGGRRGGGGGPYALPGQYTVTLKAGAATLTRTMALQMDPRITVTAMDLKAQLDAGLTLRDLTAKIGALITQADSAVAQLTTAAGSNPAAQRILDQAKDFRFRMGRVGQEQGYRIQGRLREEITSLAGSIAANPGAPTAGELVRIKEVTADLDKMTTDWQAFLKGPAAAFVK
jgi:hypothetical protein